MKKRLKTITLAAALLSVTTCYALPGTADIGPVIKPDLTKAKPVSIDGTIWHLYKASVLAYQKTYSPAVLTDQEVKFYLGSLSTGQILYVEKVVQAKLDYYFSTFKREDIQTALVRSLSNERKSKHTLFDDTSILRMLSDREGSGVHWNKSEKSFTSPYGIYDRYHPLSDMSLYIKRVARKYHIPLNRANITKVNKHLNNDLIKKYAIRFYRNMLEEDVAIYRALIDTGRRKAAVSYFVTSVNISPARARKMLVNAVNLKFKTKTPNPLRRNGLLTEVGYQRIIGDLKPAYDLNGAFNKLLVKYYNSRSKAKKKLFLHGWLNRAKSLL